MTIASAISGYEYKFQTLLDALRDARLEVEEQVDDLRRTAELFDWQD
jgi:hypothetical protein